MSSPHGSRAGRPSTAPTRRPRSLPSGGPAATFGEGAPEPQQEREEPRLHDPSPADLSKRNYVAILKRAVKEANEDHITNLAAALAYYAFLAIPATLLIAAG